VKNRWLSPLRPQNFGLNLVALSSNHLDFPAGKNFGLNSALRPEFCPLPRPWRFRLNLGLECIASTLSIWPHLTWLVAPLAASQAVSHLQGGVTDVQAVVVLDASISEQLIHAAVPVCCLQSSSAVLLLKMSSSCSVTLCQYSWASWALLGLAATQHYVRRISDEPPKYCPFPQKRKFTS